MKFIDNIYFLLSYTNASDIRKSYPNFKAVLYINVLAFFFYGLISSFLLKCFYVLLWLVINLNFQETRGITLSFIPMTTWVLLFANAGQIPMDWRRPIDVNTLQSLEKKLGSISFEFSKSENENVFFDLLAWIPYGIVHYIMPVIVGVCLMLFYKPTYTSIYLFFFGIMNTVGVMTQLIWPTAPPWYYKKNGTKPADYTMHGDPAGLQRIDNIFHLDIYNTTFTENPLPWGAWPSLHSGFAVYSATFLIFLFPKFSPLFLLYVAWIWWATMYLGHHYFVDLLGGFVYAFVTAMCGVIYLMRTKPIHKDFVELKSIMIQEEINTPGYRALSKSEKNEEINNSYDVDEKKNDVPQSQPQSQLQPQPQPQPQSNQNEVTGQLLNKENYEI
jgi:membrane-associated phospholipid phosphatase